MKWLSLLSIILISGLGLLLFNLPVSAITSPNTLIKGSGEAVYFLGSDNKRYVFPNQKIYNSWYENFNLVQEVSDDELASYPLGGNINYRPGTRLVKITSVPTVYAVGPGGRLYPLLNEQAAISLYGENWASRVDDLADAFFAGYTIAPMIERDQYPEGSIFKYGDNNVYHYLQNHEGQLKARLIPDDVFVSMRFQEAYVLNSPFIFYPTYLPIDVTEINLSLPAQPADQTIPIPDFAILTAKKAGLTSMVTKEIVSQDPEAILMRFILVGDIFQSITTQSITTRFYIDAKPGIDDDYNLGSDKDNTTTKYVSNFIESVFLRDYITNKRISNSLNVNTNGIVTIPITTTVLPAESRYIEVVAKMKKYSTNTARLAVDINPQTDISSTANLSDQVAYLPATSLNGGATPLVSSTFIDHGKLTITSKSLMGDQIFPLDQNNTPYGLDFEAESEDFLVDTITIEAQLIPTLAFLPLHRLEITYYKKTGNEITITPTRTEGNIFTYKYLNLWVPRGSKKSASFHVTARNNNDDSGTKVRLNFIRSGFKALPQITEGSFRDSSFSDKSKLEDKTNPGPYLTLRHSYPSLKLNADSPTELTPRFNKSRALIFETMAHKGPVSIKKLSFKIETTDIDIDGDDNDMLERMADLNPRDLAKIYYHNDKIPAEERVPVTVSSWKFGIYKPNIGLNTAPQGLQTKKNDYGIIVAYLGANYDLLEGQNRILDFDFDSTTITAGSSASYKIIILGDRSSTPASLSNFQWDDGSGTLSSGYLVFGLDLYSRILFVN